MSSLLFARFVTLVIQLVSLVLSVVLSRLTIVSIALIDYFILKDLKDLIADLVIEVII